eukprot:7780-Heterococcus_DN1.PRE.3
MGRARQRAPNKHALVKADERSSSLDRRQNRNLKLEKAWELAVKSGQTRAAAACLRHGASVEWPIFDGGGLLSALVYAIQKKDCAMAYLLLSEATDSQIGELLHRWRLAVYNLPPWSKVLVGMNAAAGEMVNNTVLTTSPPLHGRPSLAPLAALVKELPDALQWGASLALCAMVESMQQRNNRSGTLEYIIDVMTGGSANCTSYTWLTVAGIVSSTAGCTEYPNGVEEAMAATATLEAVAANTSRALTAVVGEKMARRSITGSYHTAAGAAVARYTVSTWAGALLCIAWWSPLRRWRLYDLPCFLVPLPPERGVQRSALLIASAGLLLVEVVVFALAVEETFRTAPGMKCAELWLSCEQEQYTFFIAVVQRVAVLLLVYHVPVWALSCVRWLLAAADITVLRLAVKHNKQWLVSYMVRDCTDVTRRTANGSFLGIAAEGFAVDTALGAIIAALKLQQRAPLLRLNKLGSTLTRVFSNSEAALVSFDVIHTACQKGWDAAVVVRLLYMWLQSQQGKGADVIAVIAQQNDCVALRALVQVYALCDARYRGSDDSVTDSDAGADEDTVGSKTAYEQCSSWLEGAVVSMCDLQTVTDKCHLADEELVLTAVAAARIAQRGRYTVGLRARRMQLYAQSRCNAAAAKAAAAATATAAATTNTSNKGAVFGAVSRQWQRLRSGTAADQQKHHAGSKRASVAETAVSNNDDAELTATEGFTHGNSAAVSVVAPTASTDSADTDTAAAGSGATLTSGSSSQLAETSQPTAAATTAAATTGAATTGAAMTGAVSGSATPQTTAQQRLTSAWRAFCNEHPGEQQALAPLHEAAGSNAVLQRERDALDNKHTQAEAAVAELQAIVNARDTDMQRLGQQLTDERDQHAATRVDLTNTGTALTTAGSKLATTTTAVSDMSTEVRQLKRQLAYTELRLTASAAQSNARRDASYALQWRLDERDRQLGERNGIIDSVQLQLSSERTAHAATQTQLAASKVQLTNTETLLTATNAELAAAVAECGSVKAEATAQQQRCDQQLAERDGTISSLQEQLLDERSTHAATRAELVSAAEQLHGFAGTEAQLADSDAKLAAAVRRADDAEIDAAASTAQLNIINELLQQRDATVSQQLTSLADSAAELANTKAELATTQAALATAVTECGTVATEAAAQQLRSNQQLAERDNTINSLSQQLTTERHERTVTRRELADTKVKLSSTVVALATAESKLTTAVTAALDAAADKDKVKRQLVRAELQLFGAAAQSKVLRDEALAVQQQLDERGHKLAEQSSAVSRIQQQLN